MNITKRYTKAIDALSALRSALLDELLYKTELNSPEYLQLEKEFKNVGKVIEQLVEQA